MQTSNNKILRLKKHGNSGQKTHYSHFDQKMPLRIDNDHKLKFWKTYLECVNNGETVGISEFLTDESVPLTIRMKLPFDNGNECHNDCNNHCGDDNQKLHKIHNFPEDSGDMEENSSEDDDSTESSSDDDSDDSDSNIDSGDEYIDDIKDNDVSSDTEDSEDSNYNSDNDNNNGPFNGESNISIKKFATSIINIVHEVMCKIYEFGQEKMVAIVALTPKSIEESETVFSYFIDVYFPYYMIKTSAIPAIKTRIICNIRRDKLSQLFPVEPIGGWDNIIKMDADCKTTQNLRLLYGSVRENDQRSVPFDKYEIHVIDGYLDTMNEINTSWSNMNKIFLISNHSDCINGSINPTDIIDQKLPWTYYLPLFTSSGYNPQVLGKVHRATTRSIPEVTPTNYNYHRSEGMSIVSEKMGVNDKIEGLLPLLNQHKRLDRQYYIDAIGKAIYASFDGSMDGFNLWKRFIEGGFCVREDIALNHEQMADHYSRYTNFKENNLTWKTVAAFARADNYEGYNNWLFGQIEPLMNDVLQFEGRTPSDRKMAVLFHALYCLDFAYDAVHSKWYQFKNHRWKINEGKGNEELRRHINEKFTNYLERYRSDHIVSLIPDADTAHLKDELNRKDIAMTRTIACLGDSKYKTKLITELQIYCRIEGFSQSLDASPYILGCNNGVIEIVDKVGAYFRPGKPEDFISKSTGISYPEEYSLDHQDVKLLETYLNQVFVNKNLRQFMRKYCASLMLGRNADKKLTIFVGEKDASKSMFQRILSIALGEYADTFQTTLMSGNKSHSSQARSDLCKLDKRRVGFMDEPEADEKMKTGVAKQLTGGDAIAARQMYQIDGKAFEAMFKLILVCNKVPPFPDGDEALRERLLIVIFESQWVDDPPESINEQYKQKKFKKDRSFDNYKNILARAMLWVMTQDYAKYATEGLAPIPKEVQHQNSVFWKENNNYQMFIDRYIKDERQVDRKGHRIEIDYDERTKDTPSVSFQELFSKFKVWFKHQFEGSQIPSAPTVESNFKTLLGNMDNKRWYGIKFEDKYRKEDVENKFGH